MSKSKWKKVDKLDKRTAFSGYPVDSLHRTIRQLAPKVREISDIGVSPTTNAYLKKKMAAWVRNNQKHLTRKGAALAVAMALLQHSPCDVENAEDFYLYVRVK